MKIVIRERSKGWLEVDPVELPGACAVGRGNTIEEALGNFLIAYQKELGLDIEVDASAQKAENKRRRDALAQR
jgi:predicted RNase H-like HicB family nuclease